MDERQPTSTGNSSRRNLFRHEHDLLVNEIIKAMSATGKCRCWSQPTGAAFRDGEMIRYGVLGSADISGIVVGGRRLEVEVKTRKAVQQKNQRAFQAMITAMGGIYFVARSVPDAIEQLNHFIEK